MNAVLARSHHHHCGSSGRECGYGSTELKSAILAPRRFSPSFTTPDSRMSSLLLVVRAGKGKRRFGAGIPQPQHIPSLTKFEDDGNPKFVIFVRDKQRGTSVSCATQSTPPVNAGEMEAFPDTDMNGSASASSCVIKRPWLTKLMLSLSGCEKPWLVPWTSFTIFQVMFLWFCTFWLVGSWIIPFAAHYAGCSKDTLTYRGQALYSLITDIAEGTVGLGILHRCLARFKPLPRNWFPFSWRGQWYIDVLLGCLTFPVVNRLSQLNLELLPFPSPFTASYEQSIMARDPIASVLYAIVVSVCCPIWEEVIFRGFLLPSLTRYLPMWASIFVSAIFFGLAHFNVQRMLPLTFLGLVMGIMFVRSRNLLSSMLLHSLWNGFVFMGLLR
ncbi:hypothetical protein GOP47_0018375 [Adiantum capillus-veneris]|uniref:CAAX prenyl protease 2/Lysostaphin resistance protein A-like domain-containing protein n=1 Tax=Adiantum capillus-veneris TaxID=13818 RepID=A0A9D4UD32_ADICA|nr:hypothetical protein GOP47_0018375 [Adiantum capillus-veneris]